MEKYDRICHLCCSMLDVRNYLLKINKELTSVGPVFIHILDFREENNSQAHLCTMCYCTLFTVQKAKDELRQRKRELKVEFLVA